MENLPENLLQKLRTFFRENKSVIIVNTSTDQGLLCLNPTFKMNNDTVTMTYDSLDDDRLRIMGFKALQGEEPKTLYLENDQDNIMMLQAINLATYRQYIRPNYINFPEIKTQEELEKAIQNQPK
jgi:hypothetical protein